MALTGQLSDMSLAELIEFFCNQRKTGRLKVDYHRGHGVFFIKEGELVDAKVGQLSGSEAVYFALTLPNAAFDFSPEVQPTRRTINEAWTQVVLEGLRRLDEGVSPTEADAFGGWTPTEADLAVFMDHVDRLGEGTSKSADKPAEAAPFSMMVESAENSGSSKKKFMLMGAAACVVLAVGVAAIPLMSGSGKPAAGAAPQAVASQPDASPKSSGDDATSAPAASDSTAADAAATDASTTDREREERLREQRLREQRERKAEEAKKADAAQDPNAPATAAAATGPKSVRVSVTYDEAGRVTATSVAGSSPGAEAFAGTAVRIARGKRFPAGKAGSTVVTIPVN
jgi:Domain of unknown function (DUF4388)